MPTLREHHEDDENGDDLIERIPPSNESEVLSGNSLERQNHGNSSNSSPKTANYPQKQQSVGSSVENNNSKSQSPPSTKSIVQNQLKSSQIQRQSSLDQKHHFQSNSDSPIQQNLDGGITSSTNSKTAKSLLSVAPMQYPPQQGFNWQVIIYNFL